MCGAATCFTLTCHTLTHRSYSPHSQIYEADAHYPDGVPGHNGVTKERMVFHAKELSGAENEVVPTSTGPDTDQCVTGYSPYWAEEATHQGTAMHEVVWFNESCPLSGAGELTAPSAIIESDPSTTDSLSVTLYTCSPPPPPLTRSLHLFTPPSTSQSLSTLVHLHHQELAPL